jgi:hypothetical protein
MTTATAPQLTAKQLAAVEQGLFPFMLRFGNRAWVRVRDAASELGLSEDFFRSLIDLGELECIAAGAKGDRKTYTIATRSLILWMLRHSNIDPAEHLELVRDFLHQQPAAVLRQVIALAQARLDRLSR